MLEIIETIPHDTHSYTQGYFFKEGYLYESTGLYGRSSLRKINPKTGEIIKKIDISNNLFSEGIDYYKDNIYMLTWREKICKVFDFDFNELKSFNYDGEGWGLSIHKNKFYMSDGTNNIKVIDPLSFSLVDKFSIFENDKPVNKLNELQFVEEKLLANIWFSDNIAVISDNKLEKFIDLSLLRKYLKNSKSEALNGIAYDAEEKIFYITGKLWDLVFKVKMIV